jgi:16S rRNA (guanine966-N2)-methyltransferase
MTEAGRVIAGTARGTRLVSPGEGTRPIGDRVKETLFAILEPHLDGARILDLFAGSGACGIEALSRGAASAVLVERDAAACRIVEENLRRARVYDRATVVRAEVIRYLKERAASDGPFDVVVVDPPYAESKLLESTLELLGAADSGLITAQAWVVAKHFWRTPPPPALGLLASARTRRFGETGLAFYRPTESSLADAQAGSDEAAT